MNFRHEGIFLGELDPETAALYARQAAAAAGAGRAAQAASAAASAAGQVQEQAQAAAMEKASTAAAVAANPPAPWIKRHPVLFYGGLAAGGAGLLYLLLRTPKKTFPRSR